MTIVVVCTEKPGYFNHVCYNIIILKTYYDNVVFVLEVYIHIINTTAMKPSQVDPHIWVKWVTFL